MEINIGIEESKRKNIAGGLGDLLADSYLLYLKSHNYHWNVTGPMFQTLHSMFEEQYTELATAVDDIAERIRALGEYAPGTFIEYSNRSHIKERDGVPSATDMIEDLLQGHEKLLQTARKVIPVASDGGDEATADLLTQRLQLHEKTAWMLRSMLD